MAQEQTIFTVDTHYVCEKKTASYLIVEGAEAAFVDNAAQSSLPHLLAALDAHGLTPEQVRYVIVTHAHLDHAGCSFALMRACPNAVLLAHPKAARHLINPERLVAGTRQVYGAEMFDKLYGEIAGVPEDRVRTMEDGEVLAWGGRNLRFLYTLGHASHHFCIYDDRENSIFTGDSFGLGLSDAVRPGPGYLVCTSSPPEFDHAEAHKAIDAILATGAATAYIGHYGAHTDMANGAAQLGRSLDAHKQLIDDALTQEIAQDDLEGWFRPRIAAAMEAHLRDVGVLDVDAEMRWLEMDIMLNALGLSAAVARARKSK